MGVREDLERIRSGIQHVQAEVDPWLDRWVTGEISRDRFDQQTKAARTRMDALARELDRLRRAPRDAPGAELDLLIEDVEVALADVRRRREVLGVTAFDEASVGPAHQVVAEKLRDLEDMLARLRSRREERAHFTDQAMVELQRAVSDGVIDEQTLGQLRPYLV